jgi:hypothetical protein
MEDAFDSELYLRLACERQILDPLSWEPRGLRISIPIETAMALVAIGAIESDNAAAILDDYAIALSIRGGFHVRRPRYPGSSVGNQPPRELHASRVVVCEREIDEAWGKLTIHYVSLSDTHTSVSITAVESSPGLIISTYGGQIPQIPITDDQGLTEMAHFSGGTGRGGGYHGLLATINPISKSAEWIDMYSNRIELPPDLNPVQVYLEPIPESDAATRYLWKLVANPMHRVPMSHQASGELEVTIDTFIAAGALAADAKVIRDVHQVMAAMWGGQTNSSLPEPWASWSTNRGRQGGPSGIIGLGTVTPPIDGTTIALDVLASSSESFELHFSISPAIQPHPGDHPFVTSNTAITWWAQDDRRNHYFGRIDAWSSDGSIGSGTVVFTPAVDPDATELRIIPTGFTERAVIPVALPDWKHA